VQWLRDGLGIVKTSAHVEELARSVPSSDGVVFVPALAGLGAPHWDSAARGTITGITRGTTAAHIARATLEGIAFQVNDLLDAMAGDVGRPAPGAGPAKLRVDGGAAANDLLMQFQADISNVQVERPVDIESTGRGAAMLAGLGAGVCRGLAEVARMVTFAARFSPAMSEAKRAEHLTRWKQGIEHTRSRA
jgi:glycerol kinase